VDPSEHVERMKGMGEDEVGKLLSGLKRRLGRENEMSRGILEEAERVSAEMDWELRIGDDGEGEEEEAVDEVKVEKVDKGGEEDEDLFGDDDDDDDIVMIDPPPSVKTENMATKGKEKNAEKGKSPNPREGWTVVDYVRFMETGKRPTSTAL